MKLEKLAVPPGLRCASRESRQAKSGTFRRVPWAARQPVLKRDYHAMRDMYLTDAASFDEILTALAELEGRINQVAGG